MTSREREERVEIYAKLYAVAKTPEEREMIRKVAEDTKEVAEARHGLLRSTNPDRIGRKT